MARRFATRIGATRATIDSRESIRRKIGQDFYQTCARTRVERGFFSCPFLPQTLENKQKMPRNGTFFFRAKARLHTTLVIFPSEKKNPIFITCKRFARIAANLRFAIFSPPKRDSQKKVFRSGTPKRFARIRRSARICESIRANRAI